MLLNRASDNLADAPLALSGLLKKPFLDQALSNLLTV